MVGWSSDQVRHLSVDSQPLTYYYYYYYLKADISLMG